MASWLVRSTPERAVRARALAGDIVLCSWARHFTLTVLLSAQVYKWVSANLKLRGNPAMDLHPIQGEQKYCQSLHATETGISTGLMCNLARMQTLPTVRGIFLFRSFNTAIRLNCQIIATAKKQSSSPPTPSSHQKLAAIIGVHVFGVFLLPFQRGQRRCSFVPLSLEHLFPIGVIKRVRFCPHTGVHSPGRAS